MSFTSGLLAIKPRVWIKDAVLHARTNLFIQFLSFGSFCKRVEADPDQHVVRIDTRYLWLFHSRRDVAFDDISHIAYEFSAIGTEWGGMLTQFQRQDQVERYKVSLILNDGRDTPVYLFSFMGEGAVETGTWGVLMGDDWLDAAGDQDIASRDYVEYLCAATGKKLNKPWAYMERIESESPHRCASCGRGAAEGRHKCVYCGGLIVTDADG